MAPCLRFTPVLVALAFLGAAASACGEVTATVVLGPGDAGVGPTSNDGADSSLFGDAPALPESAPGCANAQGLVTLPDGRCTGDIGKKTFLFAVCACTSMQIAGTLTTDALDSTTGSTSGTGASIGADTSIHAESGVYLQGSAWAGGTGLAFGTPATQIDGSGVVTREIHAGGDLTTKKPFTVEGDLFVTGDIFAAPTLTCDGAVHISPGGNTTNVNAIGGVVSGVDLAVADPCDCTQPIAIPPIVAAFANANDDAAIGLDKSSLLAPSGPVSLPCGRYYFDGIGGDAVSLVLSGHTAIFVGGDVNVKSALTISLAPGAELDLFIAGNLSLNGDVTLGTPDAPARARVYVGGTSANVSGAVKIGANVYAPNADMAISSDFQMSGALLVHSLAVAGSLTVHYDVSILNVEGCAPAAKTCTTCHDCAGATPACTGGACTACVTNTDCCAPLVCRTGRCVADVR